MPRISVAICTWNRSAQLATTLEHLSSAHVPAGCAWEVVVVNNACTDDTSQVVASFVDRLPIRETSEPRSGLSTARNRALAETAGTVIAFIDDDVRVHPGWLASLARLESKYPDCAVLAGPVRPFFSVSPDPELVAAFPYLRKGFCSLDHRQPEGPLESGLLPAGANMAFRRTAIARLEFALHLGPANGSLEGHEDVDFVRRVYALGGTAVWSPDLVVDHRVDPSRMTLDYLVRLERDRARTRIRSAHTHPGPKLFGVPVSVLGGLSAAHAAYAFWSVTPMARQKLIWKVRCERYKAKAEEHRAGTRAHT